jgi:tubulin alpha
MSMRQANVVTVGIGQCGVQAMGRYWRTLIREHNLSENGWQITNCEDLSAMVHFTEHSQNKFTPRCLFMDLDATTTEVIQTSSIKDLFGPHSFVAGKISAANCYARGRFSTGKTILSEASNKYRRLVEECDRQIGFLKLSSLGGGTGSGFTNLFFSENPTSKDIQSTSIELAPSAAFATSTTAYYNTVLQFNEGYDSFRYHILFDNLTLYKRSLMEGLNDVSYVHLNDIIAQVISSFTASMRFAGTMDCSLEKLATNLVPFPAMKYVTNSKIYLLHQN